MRETLRGALLSVLFFGGLALFAAPVVAQAGGGSDPCDPDDDSCTTVIGEYWDAEFIQQQLDALERLFQAHYEATNPTTGPACYSDCLFGPTGHPSQNMTPEELKELRQRLKKMSDEACDLVGEITAIGGIASLTAAGAERWLKKFSQWVARHGGKAAAAKLLPAGVALEVVAAACYISGKF